MKKIVFDAGHGLTTAGKQTPRGVKEWTLNNAVCLYIAEILSPYDIEIKRSDDTTGKTDTALAMRTKTINAIMPDMMVSIHHNAYTGSWNNATGVEAYSHASKPKRDADLATLFSAEISKLTGLKNRGAKQDNFHMIRETNQAIPSVLCEGGFMDGENDEPIIVSEKGQKAYAQAVANVIISYLELNAKTPASESTKLYKVQLGAYSTKSNADAMLDKLKNAGFPNAIIKYE